MIIIGSIEKKHSRFKIFYFVNFYLYKNIHKAMFLKEAAQTILTGGSS
jgi:hypothetical protein